MQRQTRTTQLQIRLTAAEKRSISEGARTAGMSVSAWVLAKLLPDLRCNIERLIKAVARPQEESYALAELNDLLTSMSRHQIERTFEDPMRLPESPLLKNQIAAMIELAAHRAQTEIPPWVRDIPPLSEPHFGTGLLGLRLHLLTSAPPPFRRRNIFVDASLGDRH